jgi:hypothetical protein
MELALLNQSGLSLLDLEFQRRALTRQMIAHFVPAWAEDKWRAVGLSFRLPENERPWPYAVYSDPNVLPVGSFFPIYYRSQVPDGELGDHDPMEAQILAAADPLDATTPSHEGLETRGDVPCDVWIPSGVDGVRLAAESADGVEDTSYPIVVDDVEGQAPRSIRVSNFVLPAWFVLGSPGPWDYLGVLSGPQTLTEGGYVIKDDNGSVTNVFGGERARASFAAKTASPFTRAARRTSKVEAAVLGVDWVAHHRAKYPGAPKAA